MADMKDQIQEAYNMVDRRQNDAALKSSTRSSRGPPNRWEIPPARPTIFDHLQTARPGPGRAVCRWSKMVGRAAGNFHPVGRFQAREDLVDDLQGGVVLPPVHHIVRFLDLVLHVGHGLCSFVVLGGTGG